MQNPSIFFRARFLCNSAALLAILSLVACSVSIEDKEAGNPVTAPMQVDYKLGARSLGISEPTNLAALESTIIVGEKPNDYRLQLHLDSSVSAITRVDLDTQASAIVSLTEGKGVDVGVQPGHRYEYRTADTRAATFRIDLPLDLVIDGDVSLPPANAAAVNPSTVSAPITHRYRRVFIGPQGRLISFDSSYVLETEELIVQKGGQVVTFPVGSRALAGAPGRSAGNIEIRAILARGDLHVDVSGENGGHGLPGEEMPPAPDARSTSDHYPTQKGNPGHPGQPGGNTGAFTFVSVENSQLNLSLERKPGSGGAPGPGGPGQKGGLGAPLLDRYHQPVYPPQRRASYPDGPRGDDSTQWGAVGQWVGDACVKNLLGTTCAARP